MSSVCGSYEAERAREPAAQRDAADRERQRDEAQQARLGPAPAGSDRADGPGPALRLRSGRPSAPAVMSAAAPAGSGPGRSGARRRRRSSRRRPPGCPLTYVPFVLPRSSTYQALPRNVRTACSADANGSSTTIELFTSRPERRDRVEGERRARPAARRAGDSTMTSRPRVVVGSRAAARRSRSSVRTTRQRKRYSRSRNPSRTIQSRSSSPPSISSPARPAGPPGSCRRRGSGHPAPRTTSMTASPLTRDPFVLPRSV